MEFLTPVYSIPLAPSVSSLGFPFLVNSAIIYHLDYHQIYQPDLPFLSQKCVLEYMGISLHMHEAYTCALEYMGISLHSHST